jgi:hypothetical protein
MRNLISILIFIFLFGCNLQSEKDEIKELFIDITELKLPEDFEVVINELHGNYQTSDSDFSRDVVLKFSKKSFDELIESIENSKKYNCDTPEELSGTLPKKRVIYNKDKAWECDDFGMVKTSYGMTSVHINRESQQLHIEIYP